AGRFSGTLIGGNGRPGAYAQQLSFKFTVPKGVHDLDVNMHASHKGYLLLGQLVDPNGNAVDNQLSFQQVDRFGDSDNTNAVQLPAEGEHEHDGPDADRVRPQPVLGRAGRSLAAQLGRRDERHADQPLRIRLGGGAGGGRAVRLPREAGELLD